MMSNDNVRDIIAWELPEVELGICIVCEKLAEVAEDGLCETCDFNLYSDKALEEIKRESDKDNQDFLVELFGERI